VELVPPLLGERPALISIFDF